MTDIAAAKSELRGLMSSLFAALNPAGLRRLDTRLVRRLTEFAPSADGRTLLGFCPLPDEPEVSPFFRAWLDRGGRLILPVWLGREKMDYRQVTDWSDMEVGRGGIRQPRANAPVVSTDEVDVVVAPGRAFSEACQRLGRGSGCYDALFAERSCLKIGVAYDFQVFPAIPVGETDKPVDVVLTPGRNIDTKARDTQAWPKA